ncbi:hypothetical protein N783_13795 [Pontibacillus marinus BH030004 = DSM 16465]|uniref:Uncharacterized protein n=1 Tax=Pontibacillus marinus BH030004 = DSM 16465 TaxID=1385511 RepID=A0A0A5HQC7_9BACI|nr:hypothetical protein N783_13795 [Pontibacillus marinus BH030004 = DSM 16465]
MILRKFCSASILFVLLSIALFFFFTPRGGMGYYAVLFTFSLSTIPAILFYGLPVSAFSEWVSKKYAISGILRYLLSGFVHIFAGGLFVLVFGIISYPGIFLNMDGMWDVGFTFVYLEMVIFFLFWLIDELLRIKLPNKTWCRN